MNSLLTQYQTIKQKAPTKRFVDIANEMQISEAQLLVAHLGQKPSHEPGQIRVTRLDDNHCGDILKNLKKLNHVMALTRNKSVVNELKGAYEKLYVTEHGNSKMAIAINPKGIDLRIFLDKWRYAFAHKTDRLHSIQFFDHYGRAVHKVYTTPKSDMHAFDALAERFKHDDQSATIDVFTQKKSSEVELSDSQIAVDDFQQAWADLQDVHHFPGLLKTFKVSKTQALRLAGSNWVRSVDSQCLPFILGQVRDKQIEIMAFVGNEGMIQIFSGKVRKLKQVGEWFNVLDANFNLHAKLDEFKHAYIIRKPTDNGTVIVSSVEFFNEQNETILTLFGFRQEGNPQANDWDNLLKLIN
jgi:putative hemin transport protein